MSTGRPSASGPADLVLVNAKVITLDPQQPVAEAVATRGEVILAAGRRTDVESLAGPLSRTIDCRGMTLLPGFVDAHCHLLAMAASLQGLDCSSESLTAISQLQRAVRDRAEATPDGQWVRGFGYDDLRLMERRHPTRWDLDETAPSNPVRLDHRSGHATVLNSHGLSLAGIHRETPDPVEGVICRDEATGEPTGLLLEMAGYLSQRLGKLRGEDDLAEGVAELDRKLLSYGITSVQDAGPNNDAARWRAFQDLQASGRLTPRITMMAGAGRVEEFLTAGRYWGCGDSRLRLGHVKVMLTLSTGSLQPDPEALANTIREARQAGFPVAIHAIEQEAIAAAVQAISEHPQSRFIHGEPAYSSAREVETRGRFSTAERDEQSSPPGYWPPGYWTKDWPEDWTKEGAGAQPLRETTLAMPPDRIEHCAECPPALAAQLRRCGAMVVTQPGFVYWNGDRYRQEVDPRLLRWLYPIGGLVSSGVNVAFGSDAPVVDPNPWPAIYSAVTGATKSGQDFRLGKRGDRGRSQVVMLESALRRYTLGGAYAEGAHDLKGSIQQGKLADLVLVDIDRTSVDPSRLKEVRPVLTVLGGRIAWQAEAAGPSTAVPA